jgi:hypothetical protein
MSPAHDPLLAAVATRLDQVIRYDDESIVHDKWIRQRYDCGCFPSLIPARRATVETAWHEAGHAVAALAVGARFSSASIHHSRTSDGRVHGISGGARNRIFVIDAAGQIGQRLRDWTMLDDDDELRAWLPTWKSDGGDARRFRSAIGRRDEVAAWRRSEAVLTPLRLQIRQVARALLVHPRHLPYHVVAALAASC